MSTTQRIARWCAEILYLLNKRPPGAEASAATVHDLHHVVNGMYHGIAEYAVWKNGEQLVGVMRQPLHEVRAELREAEATIREQIVSEGLANMRRAG